MSFAGLPLLVIVFAANSFGATASELRERYGPAVRQRFSVEPGIFVTIEYSKEGKIASVEIAPEGYRRQTIQRELFMDRSLVSQWINFFVPDKQRLHMLSALHCLSAINKVTGKSARSSCWVAESDKDLVITRQYSLSVEEGDREFVSTIRSKSGMAVAKELRSHALKSEQFDAAPGVGLTASYDEAGTVNKVVIAAARSVLSIEDQEQYVNAAPAQGILDDVVPRWMRGSFQRETKSTKECVDQSIEEFRDVTVTTSVSHCRSAIEDHLMQITVSWVPR